jgi:alpha-tubulin suppressor-like RCC1 family protein
VLDARPAEAQRLRVWGDDGAAQLTLAPTGEFRDVLPGGATQTIAIRADKTIIQWGGVGDPFMVSPVPEALESEAFRSGGCLGRSHAVVIRRDKTLASWGGVPPTWDPNVPYPVTNVPEGRFNEVACGSRHSIGLAHDGTLSAWGFNDSRQLTYPTGTFKAVAARSQYSIAIRDDGTLVGWGTAPIVFSSWQWDQSDPPQFHMAGRFKAIAAGNIHAIGLLSNGSVLGWGQNLGGPTSGNPLDAPKHVRFKAIAAGFGFSVGIDTDGTLWGWGTPVASPYQVGGTAWTFGGLGWIPYDDEGHYYVPGERFKSVSAAAFHITAITDDGK